MFTKIIAGVLSFLLWIFPLSSLLGGWQARLAFDRNAVMDQIATCVAARDVVTLESMMRPWFKTNIPDLTDKLNQFFDAIDGDIVNVNKGTSQGSGNSQGIYYEELRFGIYTTDETNPHYYLWISYDVSNSKNKNDVGISWIHLQTGANSDPSHIVHFLLRIPA